MLIADKGYAHDPIRTASVWAMRQTHKAVTHCDGAPMVLGCSAPDGYGANRTSTHTGRRPMLTFVPGVPERDQAADQQ